MQQVFLIKLDDDHQSLIFINKTEDNFQHDPSLTSTPWWSDCVRWGSSRLLSYQR